MVKEKRKTLRVPLLSEYVSLRQQEENFSFSIRAKVRDINTLGFFAETDTKLDPNLTVHCIFELPGDLGPLELTGRFVRFNWRADKKKKTVKGVAIEFKDLSESKKKILDSFVIYLRNKQIISVSKRIIEEFFGGK